MVSKNDKLFSILAKMLSKEKLSKLEREIIYQDTDGTYHLYGEYSIRKIDTGYALTKNATYTSYTFTELKNAVTWVTFDKSNSILDAERVVYLDRALSSTLEHLKLHQKLSKNGKNLEARSIILAKLNEDILKKQKLLAELENFVEKANAWQHKQFALNSAK
jgi:hypothetical protein